jgi:hypothetical protein
VKLRGNPLYIKSQGLALALGVGGLMLAAWSFDQAWEARGRERPGVAKWLAM